MEDQSLMNTAASCCCRPLPVEILRESREIVRESREILRDLFEIVLEVLVAGWWQMNPTPAVSIK